MIDNSFPQTLRNFDVSVELVLVKVSCLDLSLIVQCPVPCKLQICTWCLLSVTAAPVCVESEEETQCHCEADETDMGQRCVNQALEKVLS